MMWITGVLAVILIWAVTVYNGIVHAQLKVEEAKSGIDVALSKRYAVLTNMQESVKGYMKYESDVFRQLTEIRSSMSIQELTELNHEYGQMEEKIIALAESYPDLKASDLFHDFHEAIVDCEEHLQASRRFYNSNVTIYNEKILTFPGSIFADFMHKGKEPFFEAEAQETGSVNASF